MTEIVRVKLNCHPNAAQSRQGGEKEKQRQESEQRKSTLNPGWPDCERRHEKKKLKGKAWHGRHAVNGGTCL